MQWLFDGSAEVSARSFVGVVRFSDFDVHVVPKLVGGNLGVLRMLDYASGLNALRQHPAVRELALSGASLFDLVCRILAGESDRMLRQGLNRDYVTHEEDLTVVRGRLRYRDQLLRRFGRVDVLECRFDELETDILENRILAAALQVAARLCRHPETRAQARRLAASFTEFCEIAEFDVDDAENSIVYHRLNGHYRTAHFWAFQVLRRSALNDLYETTGGRSFGFMFDMNALFERFVTRLIQEAFGGMPHRVLPQRRTRSILTDERTGASYAAVIPDVLVEWDTPPARHRVPVDAKYKLYEDRPDQSDIYQTFLYAYAFAPPSEAHPKALIAYPATTGTGFALSIRNLSKTQTAHIRSLPIPVEAILGEIAENKLREGDTLSRLRSAILAD